MKQYLIASAEEVAREQGRLRERKCGYMGCQKQATRVNPFLARCEDHLGHHEFTNDLREFEKH